MLLGLSTLFTCWPILYGILCICYIASLW